jgi:hypothetical protein
MYVFDCNLFSGDSTNLNVEQLNFISLRVVSNPNFTGSITSWVFNTGLTYFYLYSRYLTGDITNWDISDTKIITFYLYDYNQTNNKIIGDLSDWTFPSTLTNFSLNYLSGMTALPNSFSTATSLNTLNIQYCNGITSISGITLPSSLRTYNVVYCNNLVSDINNINLINELQTIQFQGNKLYGDIESFVMPTGATILYLFNNIDITGNITGLTFNNVINNLQLYNTNIYGNIAGMSIPDSLRTLTLNNTDLYIDFNSSVFHTNQLTTLYLYSISGITGSLSNFIIDNNMNYLYIYNTNINSDLSELDVSKLNYFYAYNCGSIYGDLTNWITGTTRLYNLSINSNSNLSGDTSNWNVNGITYLDIYDTNLSGTLKHDNVYEINARNTNISSNIETDFNFNSRAYRAYLYDTNITGNLSGVTLYSGINQFQVQNCSGLLGSNHFINYIFEYRKYFTRTSVGFNISNIGDSVTGGTEALGDLGTYTQFSGSSEYYYWNLTENEVNNLVNGLDYTGTGTNIPWDSKQKIYWIKNAKISSTNLNKRYISYTIIY